MQPNATGATPVSTKLGVHSMSNSSNKGKSQRSGSGASQALASAQDQESRLSTHTPPKCDFYFESTDYVLKIVETEAEYRKAIDLRREVFYNEFGANEFFKSQYQDIWDTNADILIITDKASGKVIGTYRILCSSKTESFYTQSEFDIEDFLAAPGVKIELSRACVHKDFRNGGTLNLLWKGIAEYAKRTNARYLFGCSSIWTTKLDEIITAHRYLVSKSYIGDEFAISTNKKYAVPHFEQELEGREFQSELDSVFSIISPLLLTYIKANAKLYGQPAVDQDFNCTDFFTVLDMQNLSERFKRKYLK